MAKQTQSPSSGTARGLLRMKYRNIPGGMVASAVAIRETFNPG